MRNTIITLTLVLGLTACDDKPKEDAKGKAATAKKDVKIDAKKPDAKKADVKADAKADAKADEPKADEPKADADDGSAKIGQLAGLARAIAAKPEDADAILSQAGMDRGAFEAAMVDVAKDQWKTDLYLTALTQADQAG